MKLRLRYICGILLLICIDVFYLFDFLFPNKISFEWLFFLIFPILIIGNILNKKFGYLLDKHEKEFYIFGAILGFITLLPLIYMFVNK